MSTITPCLWFVDRMDEALDFYVDLIPNSAIEHLDRLPDGTPMNALWTLDGQRFRGIQGGPQYPQTPAFSISVACPDQAEVDRLWEALLADGGKENNCGWLVDRFGMSWQIVPDRFVELLADPDPERAGRVVQAMMGMQKLVVADLEAAADGR